jgi:hypothetical protein
MPPGATDFAVNEQLFRTLRTSSSTRGLSSAILGNAVRENLGKPAGRDSIRRALAGHLNQALRAFSGKVESGFPSEKCDNAKRLEQFLSPVHVKPL